jgi:hypothetical protein
MGEPLAGSQSESSVMKQSIAREILLTDDAFFSAL